ncbi:MAG: hemerythrin domain-containing protein [Proteobacteria bacterium]|nr:hemerythrin domain-containing protein [Pseudomonadota bacterium]
MDLDLKKLQEIDPFKKGEKVGADQEMSAMDPPDPYNPPALEQVPYEKMHPLVRELMDEHTDLITELDLFEKTVDAISKTENIDVQTTTDFNRFTNFFDEELIPHNKKEEKSFFPLLSKRLKESGEVSPAAHATTGVDVLENDHLQAIQLATLCFTFMGLAVKLPDTKSRAMVKSMALNYAKELIELLRLHIFREDKIVFGQAYHLLTVEELDQIHNALKS